MENNENNFLLQEIIEKFKLFQGLRPKEEDEKIFQ